MKKFFLVFAFCFVLIAAPACSQSPDMDDKDTVGESETDYQQTLNEVGKNTQELDLVTAYMQGSLYMVEQMMAGKIPVPQSEMLAAARAYAQSVLKQKQKQRQ